MKVVSRSRTPHLAAVAAEFRKEFLLHRRDPAVLGLLVAAPVVLTILLTHALGGALSGGAVGGGAAGGRAPDYVLVEGAAPLEVGPPVAIVSLERAREMVRRGEVPLAVAPGDPAAPGTGPDGGRPRLIADPADPTAVLRVLVARAGATIDVRTPSGRPYAEAASPHQQTVPGFAVTFGFFACMFTALAFYREQYWGTTTRLLALPMRRADLMLGKALPMVVIVFLQGLAVIVGGALAFGVPIVRPAALLAGLALVGAVAAALGLAVAALTRSEPQATSATPLVVLLMAALGGAIVPVSVLPPAARAVAPFTPHYWAMDLFKGAMSRGAPWPVLLVDLAVLGVFCAAFAAVAATAMRWNRFRSS